MATANINSIKDAGFTASFTGLIACLAKCKKYNLYPNILWHSSLYTNDSNENIFYKYFDLIGFEKPDAITNTIEMGTWEQLQVPRMEWRKILCKTYSDHIVLKHDLSADIFKDMNMPFVGIHIRNTDRAIEPEWASPGIQYVINRLIYVLKEYQTKVGLYIASDNVPDVSLLKECLNNNRDILPEIVFIEDPKCIRSPNQTSVHGNLDSGLDVSKEAKALSIITDIYCLARCEKVIRTCSNVTSMVGIISPTTVFVDVSLEFGKKSDEWLQVDGI